MLQKAWMLARRPVTLSADSPALLAIVVRVFMFLIRFYWRVGCLYSRSLQVTTFYDRGADARDRNWIMLVCFSPLGADKQQAAKGALID